MMFEQGKFSQPATKAEVPENLRPFVEGGFAGLAVVPNATPAEDKTGFEAEGGYW